MSGFNLERKFRRTKQEQLRTIENMNRDAIEKLAQQQMDFVEKWNMLIPEILNFQREILAIKNTLKKKGIVTEFDISQERSSIEELRKMESEAIIIGGEK